MMKAGKERPVLVSPGAVTLDGRTVGIMNPWGDYIITCPTARDARRVATALRELLAVQQTGLDEIEHVIKLVMDS